MILPIRLKLETYARPQHAEQYWMLQAMRLLSTHATLTTTQASRPTIVVSRISKILDASKGESAP
jgi:hypothetical protein